MPESAGKKAIRKAGEILSRLANKISEHPWKITIEIGASDDKGHPKVLRVKLEKAGHTKYVDVPAEDVMYDDEAKIKERVFNDGPAKNTNRSGETTGGSQEPSADPTASGTNPAAD